MIFHKYILGLLVSVFFATSLLAAPVIDPIADVTIPAGKSLILPITATSPSGSPLTYTIFSSTNAFAVVMHTNNPFWQLSVAQAASASAPGAYQTPYRGGLVTVTNVGVMTFMLFPEYAPHAVNVFQGLTDSGFYNSNTIFHRVVSNFVIQGGDPDTNGSGGLVFEYDDEFNPQAIFSGNGQLALANSGKNTDGSQFFVTIGPQRFLDFGYTLFGQLVRGFDVMTNINSTAADTNSRPLADEIIQTASYVTNTADTVITLTATNRSGKSGTITVMAVDGVGGSTTQVFHVATVTDTNDNHQAFYYNSTLTNLVAPVSKVLTNNFNAYDLAGDEISWYPQFADENSYTNGSGSHDALKTGYLKTLTYNVTNADGQIQLFTVPATNYAGTINVTMYASYSPTFSSYAEKTYSFVFGDTPISGQSNVVTAAATVPFVNLVLATFTNRVAGSAATNFTAVINWGDNSTNYGTVTSSAGGQKAVLGSHTYAYPGSYPVYVQVTSAIGATATILSFINVTNQTDLPAVPFTMQVLGQGSVLPTYNITPLVVGESYSVSATPSAGWVFTNWTDENGFIFGTDTNLTFTMASDLSLTANFTPISTPILTFVSPVTGSMDTNYYASPATITGTATDQFTVTGVWVQVNGGGWQPATGTTSWTAAFTPAYGITNVIQAYAVNNYGVASVTNTVWVKYLAGAVLSLSTNGPGGISPNLNNELLPLGTNYTLTATPAAGFAFASWSGGLSSASAKLNFTLTSDLALTANFVDLTKPVITISNLVNNQSVSNSMFTVRGKVTDNWRLASVQYQLNSSDWTDLGSSTNWSVTLNLVPGANIFRIDAADATGTRSLTNTLTINYIVSAPLQLSTTGLGTITPNDSNALLQVGKNYTLIAKAATGFAFANWTGSLGTNNANLSFTMASNLFFTANFTDVTRPTVTVTNLVTGQRVSNSVFTVMGKAADNWQLAGVEYQLNYNGWTNASGGSNWSAVLNLNSGTNIFQVYAYDTTGNHSLTNTLVVDYVVSAPLQLSTIGLGTITPNYSNALLEVGKNYTITAKAATGFTFANWTGSSTTNNANLTFTMASNLSFTANFTDVTRPTVTVTNLVTGQRVSNSVFTVIGKATDNWQLAGVQYQLNYSGWTNASGGPNWMAVLNLNSGTNTFQVYSYDTTGNHSLTNTLAVIYVVSAQLQLQVSGSGTVSPNYSNALLEVGRNYTVTAAPAKGWVLYNWLGSDLGMLTNSPTLTFTMSPGLSLTANFHQPPAILTQPTNVLAFYDGSAAFAVTAGGTGPLAYQWQFNSTDLAQNSSNLTLSGLTTDEAGSYRVIVSSYSESVTSSVVKLSLTNAPTSFAGLDAIITADKTFQVDFGTNTFSLFSSEPTNNNSGVGSYEYTALDPLNGVLALDYLLPPEIAGPELVDVTFVSPGWAVFTNDNGSGTIQYFTATNFVPSVWTNHVVILAYTNTSIALTLRGANIFTAIVNTNGVASGSYAIAKYSPGAAWLQLTGTGDGSIYYAELQFTNASSGSFILENFDTSENLTSENVGRFTYK